MQRPIGAARPQAMQHDDRLTASPLEIVQPTPAVEEHSHDTDNHGLITAGTLYLSVQGKEQKFSAGQWYYVPAHVPHAARFEEDTAEIEFWFKK